MPKEFDPIYVTMPSLAPLEEFTEMLKGVWQSGILTHNGPLVQRFEKDLINKLGLKHLAAVNNGTIAIQIAIKALKLKGEIITTPFTWIATLSAIQWEGCQPIFCDIDPATLNIDPCKIEDKITDKTVAILPVHVFGNPCDVETIKSISKKYNLKVIYDAAHAVGSTFNGQSLLNYGDVSATSFHATKLLNTAEGGGCITDNSALFENIKYIRFFGHDERKEIVEQGFNGKLTEVHAALGLANLPYMDTILEDRKYKYLRYIEKLSTIPMIKFQKVRHDETNYSYFPIVCETETMLLRIEKALNKVQIFPRRYFYPSVNTFTKIISYQPCPISEDISKRILCLPLYWSLSESTMDRIVDIIKQVS